MNENQPLGEGKGGGMGALRVLAGTQGVEMGSVEAEECLAGCWLMDDGDSVLTCVRLGLKRKAFTNRFVAMVWGACTRLVEAGNPVGVVTVGQELMEADREGFLKAGGFAAVDRLADGVGTTAQMKYFAGKVMDYWRARQARWLLMKSLEVVGEKAGDWSGTYGEVAGLLGTLQGLRPESGEKSLKQAGESSAETLRRMVAGEVDRSRWLHTGLRRFEEQLGAVDFVNEEMLVLVVAEPSGGKSAFLRQIVNVSMELGRHFGVFLLETSKEMYLRQMASARAGVNLRTVAGAPGELQERIQAAHTEVEAHLEEHLWVWDDVYELGAIEAQARELARSLGGQLHGIVVDYVQLVSAGKRCRTREEEVALVARQLKLLAKDIGCPVLAACQINREARKEGRRPTKSDLRESGALEQAADRIIALHVPRKDLRGQDQTDNQARVMVEICQLKNRNGALGARAAWFDRPFVRFVDMGQAEESEAAREGSGRTEAAGPRPGDARKGKGYGR